MPRSDGRLIAWKYLPISAHALNLDLLLAPQLVSDGLDVVGANSLQPDFLNALAVLLTSACSAVSTISIVPSAQSISPT
jgi:hypothetical protein